MSQLTRQRRRLWKKDPHCYWCGRPIILPEVLFPGKRNRLKNIPDNMATTDHLYSRLNPKRYSPRENGHELRHVLACIKCNAKRAKYEELRFPLSRLHKRQGQITTLPFWVYLFKEIRRQLLRLKYRIEIQLTWRNIPT